MTIESSVQLSRIENDIACVTLDMPGSAANILSDQMLTELQTCLDAIGEMENLKGLILISAKPKIFVAGANLKEINAALDWPDEKIIAFANRGRKIYQAFGEFDFPSVAAIHGACVGGGLELAMGCNFRIATKDRRSIVGLPETNLGLIPGWAGTVRIPRIVGLQKGLELIVSGKNISSEAALELGIIQQTVDSQADLLPAAIEFLRRAANSDELRQNPSCLPLDISESEADSISQSVATKGFAQEVVKEHIVSSCNLPFEVACDSEAIAFAKTWGSDESRGLLNNFFLGEHNRKQPGFVDLSLETQPIQTLGIVGAGLMGRGIAAAALKAGLKIKLLDANLETAQSVAEQLGNSENNIEANTDYGTLSTCELVIESATEDKSIKLDILKKIESAVGSKAIIASNTSSLPITELGETLNDASRFCGIHFCHPGLMKVVEVIRGKATSEETISSAVAFVRGLRKMPIALKDGPGFVVNRVLSSMFEQAIQTLSEGNSIESIDQAIKDFGFSAGPFEMMDIIGLDTCLSAGQIMSRRGVTCVSDSPIVPRMVKKKRLGRKVLAGFYRYDADDGPGIVDPEVAKILEGYQNSKTSREAGASNLKGTCSISSPILQAMHSEACKIRSEGLVADERDIDLCLIHGLAFPASKGGLLFWFKDEASA